MPIRAVVQTGTDGRDRGPPAMHDLTKLDALTDDDEVNAIIDTPRGSRNKFKYEPALDLFTLKKVLPPGAVFPYDFGFIPSTLCQDGDPLDVLVLIDDPVAPGCLVKVRLIGVIEAEQTEDGKTVRNDRLLAVASGCHGYCAVRSLRDLPSELLDGIEHFFVSYNEMQNRKFKPLRRRGPRTAMKLLTKATHKARKASHKRRKAVKK
jgi:inorganic pyrophosphatase